MIYYWSENCPCEFAFSKGCMPLNWTINNQILKIDDCKRIILSDEIKTPFTMWFKLFGEST